MSLLDVSLKKEYRSPRDNIVTDFYIPLLKEAKLYKILFDKCIEQIEQDIACDSEVFPNESSIHIRLSSRKLSIVVPLTIVPPEAGFIADPYCKTPTSSLPSNTPRWMWEALYTLWL